MVADLLPFPSPEGFLVAEFFAGVGLARMGLEKSGFDVTWANDIEPFKFEMYKQQFPDADLNNEFLLSDIADVTGDDLPKVDLAWASFPCTDLSLAGTRTGLAGKSSSTFFEFTRVLDEMGADRPGVVAVENVPALASSHGGEDLAAAVRELNRLGYSVDILALDARRWVPQSRSRIFLVGSMDVPEDAGDSGSELRPDWLQAVYGDETLITHRAKLPEPPAPLTAGLNKYIEVIEPSDPRWWAHDRVENFLNSLSDVQTQRLTSLMQASRYTYRTAYRRTRKGVPVWEIRPDDISGCLRTARGGSSKQAVVKAGHDSVQIRWMTPVEYARLMGAGDYNIRGLRDSQVFFGFGDAVCVDAVAWLSENYLMPLINGDMPTKNKQGRRTIND